MKSQTTSLWWHHILPISLLSIITIIFYYPSLHYEFQFDDLANITKHFQIRHYSFYELFFSGTRWISYWLNSIHYKIGAFDPFSYRVGNICIHIFNGLLVFFIISKLLSLVRDNSFFKQYAFSLSWITTALFLLHPVQTQTVSYVIQGQLEGLAMLSTLLLIFCFLRTAQAQSLFGKIIGAFSLVTVSILLCGTKEIAIVAPILVMVIDWFFISQGNLRSIKKNIWTHTLIAVAIIGGYLKLLKPAFFATILGLSFQAKNNIGNIITQNPTDAITPFHYFISEFKVILHYLTVFLWPFNMSVEYDCKLVDHFLAYDCIIPFFVLAILISFVIRLFLKNKIHPIVFGALWFAICIAPRSTIVPSPELIVDYKTYMASFGWFFVIASALVWTVIYALTFIENIYSRNLLALRYIAPLFLVLPLGFMTQKRNTIWRSGLEFWQNMIDNAPQKARAYNNYGVELSLKLGKFVESIPYFQKAIDMDHLYPDPYNNIAVAYAQIGQIDRAIESLKQVLRINPYHPEGYNNIASFFLQKKDYINARRALDNALALRPYYGKAHFNLGRLNLEEGNELKAWECFKNACIKGDLDNEFGFEMYARSSLSLHKYDDAIYGYQRLLELVPDNIEIAFSLANSYALAKKFSPAIAIYEKLSLTRPGDQRIRYNLAEALWGNQQYDKALLEFTKIQPTSEIAAQVRLRIASCHENLGNPQMAYDTLVSLLQLNIPQDTRSGVENILVQLKQQHKIA